MRKLAQELGVEAMSLYRHVRNEGKIVRDDRSRFGELGVPPPGVHWKNGHAPTGARRP